MVPVFLPLKIVSMGEESRQRGRLHVDRSFPPAGPAAGFTAELALKAIGTFFFAGRFSVHFLLKCD